MKFRIAISILSIVVIGLFLTVFVQTNKVLSLNDSLEITKDSLNTVVQDLKESELNLKNSKDSLILVMKALDVWEKKAQEKRKVEVMKEARAKYKLGITVQANNADYQNLIAFVVGSGFQRDYITQKRKPVEDAPVIYYYSDEAKTIAESLKDELINTFPNKLYTQDFEVKYGESNTGKNIITVKLMFKY